MPRPLPIWQQLQQRLRGIKSDHHTGVYLRRDTTPDWIKSHDYLADLTITTCSVDRGAKLGSALAGLVRRHPLEQLTAKGADGADQVAAALAEKTGLKFLNLGDSDLTDAGFALLPLENLISLEIRGTSVTRQGLHRLSQAKQLDRLTLDGRQIGPEVIAALESREKPSYALILDREGVTDETRTMLSAVLRQYPTRKLRNMPGELR